MVLAGLFCQNATAQSAQSLALPAQGFFRDVRLSWEGGQLIFYAAYRQDGHDVTLWLECHGDKGREGQRAEIDYLEQYGRGMPIAVRLISLEKDKSGKPVLYMGQPAPNTIRLNGSNADCALELTDPAGQTDRYGFALSDGGAGLPVIRAVAAK